jgi:hypothetical protein
VTGEVPPQHLPAPPALQASHEIPSYGSPNRNRRGPLAGRFCQRFAESPERLIDGRDQGRELIWHDLIASEIRADDLRCKLSIQSRCVVVRHLGQPSLLCLMDYVGLRPSSTNPIFCRVGQNRGDRDEIGSHFSMDRFVRPVALTSLADPIAVVPGRCFSSGDRRSKGVLGKSSRPLNTNLGAVTSMASIFS